MTAHQSYCLNSVKTAKILKKIFNVPHNLYDQLQNGNESFITVIFF